MLESSKQHRPQGLDVADFEVMQTTEQRQQVDQAQQKLQVLSPPLQQTPPQQQQQPLLSPLALHEAAAELRREGSPVLGLVTGSRQADVAPPARNAEPVSAAESVNLWSMVRETPSPSRALLPSAWNMFLTFPYRCSCRLWYATLYPLHRPFHAQQPGMCLISSWQDRLLLRGHHLPRRHPRLPRCRAPLLCSCHL